MSTTVTHPLTTTAQPGDIDNEQLTFSRGWLSTGYPDGKTAGLVTMVSGKNVKETSLYSFCRDYRGNEGFEEIESALDSAGLIYYRGSLQATIKSLLPRSPPTIDELCRAFTAFGKEQPRSPCTIDELCEALTAFGEKQPELTFCFRPRTKA